MFQFIVFSYGLKIVLLRSLSEADEGYSVRTIAISCLLFCVTKTKQKLDAEVHHAVMGREPAGNLNVSEVNRNILFARDESRSCCS